MKNKILTSEELFEMLQTFIDLPDNIISLDLHLTKGSFVTMDIQRYANSMDKFSKTNGDTPLTIDEKFTLVNATKLADMEIALKKANQEEITND